MPYVACLKIFLTRNWSLRPGHIHIAWKNNHNKHCKMDNIYLYCIDTSVTCTTAINKIPMCLTWWSRVWKIPTMPICIWIQIYTVDILLIAILVIGFTNAPGSTPSIAYQSRLCGYIYWPHTPSFVQLYKSKDFDHCRYKIYTRYGPYISQTYIYR